MNVSQNGVRFIAVCEGNGLPGRPFEAYLDIGGVPTIGYGHTLGITRQDVLSRKVITAEQAELYLQQDLQSAVSHVNQHGWDLNQNQFDALVSFVYNLGPAVLIGTTIAAMLIARNYQGAADQFPRWDQVNGKPDQGVLNRRMKERGLFLS